MNFTERKCWESGCVDYLIIEYPEFSDVPGGYCIPHFQGNTTGFSIDTLDGAKAQCEAHKTDMEATP
jgi:hypothetical protein